MEHARPPVEITLDGGPAKRADAWRKWLKQFKVFLKASGVDKEDKGVQSSLLVNLLGPEGYDIFSTFKFPKSEEQDDVDIVIKKFDDYFGTRHNIIMTRFRFFSRNQESGETIDTYVTALRLLSQQCEFEHLEDSLIRDRIVCGVIDSTLRDRLLRTDELTLEKAIRMCQATEISIEQNRHIEVTKSGECSKGGVIDVVYGSRALNRADRAGGMSGVSGNDVSAGVRNLADSEVFSRNAVSQCCVACGIAHREDVRCPAKSVKCYLCNNWGHFRKMCPMRFNKRVYEVNQGSEDSDQSFQINSLDGCFDHRDNKWFEKLTLCRNGMVIYFKLDTGSDLNVISLKLFKHLGFKIEDITPCHVRAQSFCGNYIPILGSCDMLWSYKQNKHLINFIISKDNCQSVLGKYASDELGLVQRIFSININMYADLFRGVGKLPGKYKILLENNASPTICPVRKIPMGIRDKLKIELERMENIGIIRKVSHPTPWVNAIVLPAKKDGSFRVCLDPRPLNRVVRRAHYPLPTLTEIATKLRDAKYFSKLDARSGFWMIQLDDESADLCTFCTPFGRYQFLRLPYGINCASEVFQAKIRQMLEDIEGVDSFVDDVIVWGTTRHQHDTRLKMLLDRAREIGIKFNRDKCVFCVEQITYLGHVFSAKGMEIDHNKLKAIKDMPCPDNRAALERFLGMVNYLAKFIPNYSELAGPLRSLLKNNTEWYWDAAHDAAVSRLKEALCAAPVLALYSSALPIMVTVDASASALGAALLQDGRPVEFASSTLTDTQTRYAQIEKEMLAIVFAMQRFHQYVYGRADIVVETDHKPLEALFKKNLDAVPARLQRMMLRIQAYNIVVRYKPGKFMYLADALSRAALPELMHDRVTTDVEGQSCFLLNNVRFSDPKLQKVKEATQEDRECQTLIYYILKGWPSYKNDIDLIAQAHWPYQETLEYFEGVIFKDNLVFIPKALRGEMIQRVHEGHLGIDRCKRRARDVMFWNSMSSDVERAVRQCEVCSEHADRPCKEPLISHPTPEIPWKKIGSDIFSYNKQNYLILVDYFSNFVEVSPLRNITSKSVVLAMKDQFARHGIPSELITDNGPAYASREFHQFSKEWCFEHITTSPNYPQSNGLSERAVRTVKNIIRKSLRSGTDFYLGLLNLRCTPRDGISSPSQLLMGRRLNTRLPIHNDKLRPDRDNLHDFVNINRKLSLVKKYYDMHAHSLPELRAGERVIVADGDARRHMQVTARAPQPRSYFLSDGADRKYRRNRRHIIPLATCGHKSPISFPAERNEVDVSIRTYNGQDAGASSADSAQAKPKIREAAARAQERLALFFKN